DLAAVEVAEGVAVGGVVAGVGVLRDADRIPADLAVTALVVAAALRARGEADPRVGVAEEAGGAVGVARAARLAGRGEEVAELVLAAIVVRGTLIGLGKLAAAEPAVAELGVANLPLGAILVADALEEADGLAGLRAASAGAAVVRVVAVVRVEAGLRTVAVDADLALGAIRVRVAERGFVVTAADQRERGEPHHPDSKNEPVKSRHGLLPSTLPTRRGHQRRLPQA